MGGGAGVKKQAGTWKDGVREWDIGTCKIYLISHVLFICMCPAPSTGLGISAGVQLIPVGKDSGGGILSNHKPDVGVAREVSGQTQWPLNE